MTESGKRWVALASVILAEVRVDGEPALDYLERECKRIPDTPSDVFDKG